MATLTKEILISRPPADVWAVVGDLGGISSWLPAIAESSFEEGVRSCTMAGGGELTETIDLDEDNLRYEYAIVESPMELESHRASIAVEADGDGSRVVWITDVEPREMADAMGPIFDEGLQSLKSTLES